MWIVRLAIRQPYTFVVAALLILLLGVVTICRMAVDILPEINIPVVNVIWQFPGVAPEEMEQRIVTSTKRAFTTTVNDICVVFVPVVFLTQVAKSLFLPLAMAVQHYIGKDQIQRLERTNGILRQQTGRWHRQQNKFGEEWKQTKVRTRLVVSYFNWLWERSRPGNTAALACRFSLSFLVLA